MDVDQNNALVHTNMKSGHPVTLTKDSLDLYNVYGSSIFYQRYSEDNPALCMIKMTAVDIRNWHRAITPISTSLPVTSILPILRQKKCSVHRPIIRKHSPLSIPALSKNKFIRL